MAGGPKVRIHLPPAKSLQTIGDSGDHAVLAQLAYHAARAQDASFNITLEREFDHGLAPTELAPQEMTRVFLDLFGNGFYATTKRQRDGTGPDFRPTLSVATRELGDTVEVRVRDNGTGIAPEIRDKSGASRESAAKHQGGNDERLNLPEMALKIEGVVDRGMHAEEALGRSSRFEPLHLALSSPHGLMRILGPIVLPEPLLMGAGQL